MGKRELLLAAAFVLVGFVVYQVTAPPRDPNSRGVSVSGFLDEVRREIRGRRETAERTETITRPLPATIEEIRLAFGSGPVTIVGEDRADVVAELHVKSNGYDKAEAEQLANATRLKFDEAGAALIVSLDAPTPGVQRPSLQLKVPSRLAIRMDQKTGVLTITDVAAVTLGVARGVSTISKVAGAVTATQRGSTMVIADVGAVKLTSAAGADVRVSAVRGDAAFNVQSGKLRAEQLAGALDVESRGSELTFDALEKLKGTVRINASGGTLTMTSLGTDARIDGRETTIRVSQATPAPLSIYNAGEDVIEFTVPPGGVRIDALAVGGTITIDDALQQAGIRLEGPPQDTTVPEGRRETRARGAIAGGGPTITLRATRGAINIKGR